MKDKKILIIFSVITLLLITLLSIGNIDNNNESDDILKEKIDKPEDSKEDVKGYTSKDEKSKELEDIYLEKDKESIYLKILSESINPITSLNWSDNNTISFNYSYDGEGDIQNDICNYKINEDKIDVNFNIKGVLWDYRKLDNGGLIYSNDGFNGLYYMNNEEENKRITKNQKWYNISPDGKKIIVNGKYMKEKDKESNRFIYYIDKDDTQEANYIPDIDYVFSYLGATWSPDSTHIVSQIPNVKNQINIIDINEGIENEISIDNSILTNPKWSNDGEKLAFLIQSKEYNDYIFSDLEVNYYLSNKIGIYDTKTKDLRKIEFDDKLTTSEIYWSEDDKGIIMETAHEDEIKELLESSLDKIHGEVQYIDINTKNKNVILKDKVDLSDGYLVHKITPIELFGNNIFIFMDSDTNIKSINIIDLGKEKMISEEIGYLYEYSRKGNNIFLISDEGVFTIDKNLKVTNIIDFKSYYGEGILNVEVRISPNYDKAMFYVQYNENSSKKSFIEIKSLF